MENWKDIKGYEGFYKISDQGRVKSLQRKADHKGKNRTLKEKILKNGLRGKYRNYEFIRLKKNGISKAFSIHRLVAEAFVEKNNYKPLVNHIDENTRNNKFDNLEWCTHKENCNHGTRNGRISKNHSRSNVKPKKYYYESSNTRSNFKRICKNNGWIFSEFEEVESGHKANCGHKKYYYKIKEV